MKIKRVLCSLVCVGCLLTGSALAFSDVKEGCWYADAVAEMSQKGIMGGVSTDRFAPNEAVTRGTVVTVLWRMADQPQPAGAGFTDTAEKWYETAAAWCRDVKIAGGYADGSFGGQKPVTRQELAVFLCNYEKWQGKPLAEGALGLFTDAADIAEWASEAVSHAVGMGILQGDNQDKINPQGQATRAALAVMLQRMLTPAAG